MKFWRSGNRIQKYAVSCTSPVHGNGSRSWRRMNARMLSFFSIAGMISGMASSKECLMGNIRTLKTV